METQTPAPEPADPDPRIHRERGARTAWAVIVGLVGAIGAAMLVGGVAAIGAHALLRDDEGFFTTGDERFQSAGYAVISGEFDVGHDTVGVDLGDVANFELKIQGSQERPIFLGVGPTAKVDGYLAGVAHSEVDDFNRRGEAVYTRVGGGPPPTRPGAQDFWVAQSEGTGLQRVEWDLSNDSLTAVAMNADGSRGVGVDGEAGIEIGWLLWAGAGTALIGLIVAIACGFGMNRLLRSRAPAVSAETGAPS